MMPIEGGDGAENTTIMEGADFDLAPVTVIGRECPYDPKPLLGQPIGMFYCPKCGCMVIAGVEHGMCLPNLCPCIRADGSDEPGMPHPGKVTEYRIAAILARELGLIPDAPDDPVDSPMMRVRPATGPDTETGDAHE